MNWKSMISLCLGPALFFSAAIARGETNPKLISVAGDAEINVPPDQVVLNLGVSLWDKDLDAAMRQTTEHVRRVFDLLADQQIPRADIQTGYINVEPTYEDRRDGNNHVIGQVLIGYKVDKTITVVVKDLSKLEKVLAAVQTQGANRLNGIDFRSSELRKYRDQARAMAIRAAKEKAEALAHEIGQKIKGAWSITESSPSWWDWGRGSNVSQNAASVGGGGSGDTAFSGGRITIRAQVNASFELE